MHLPNGLAESCPPKRNGTAPRMARQQGPESAYPWGDAHPDPTRGNFHHLCWEPTPRGRASQRRERIWRLRSSRQRLGVDIHSFRAASRISSRFPFYPGYSANFFDGKHFVMKGGSLRTDACMLRRSFRNWFQPHYPYIYTTFRCVEE